MASVNFLSTINRYSEYLQAASIPSKKYWSWSLYSLGYTLKSNLLLRPWSQIRLGSDHGVQLQMNPTEGEEAMTAKHFVTWSKWRQSLTFRDGREVIYIKHPWIEYRHARGFAPQEQRNGTLIFVPHSVPGLKFEAFDLDEFCRVATSLPPEMQPITFSVHWHDVRGGLAEALEKRGHRVWSAGDTMSPYFADRFYNMISKFEYAGATSYGSQVSYLHEFGVKFFFLEGKRSIARLGVDFAREADDQLMESFRTAFSYENLWASTPDQKDLLTSQALGLEATDAGVIRLKDIINGWRQASA